MKEKIEIGDIDKFIGFNIKDIIDEELAKKSELSDEQLLELTKDLYIKEKTLEKFSAAFENSFPLDVGKSLLSLLNRLELKTNWAHSILEDLEEIFTIKKQNLEQEKADISEINKCSSIIKAIQLTANAYFKEYLKNEFNELSLPEQLTSIKKKLLETNPDHLKFLYKALLEAKEAIETIEEPVNLNEFTYIKPHVKLSERQSPFMKGYNEELGRRAAARIANSSNSETKNIGERETRQKVKGLNREVAYLFVDYLFDFAKINCPNTQKAEIVEFLTGFSSKQLVKVPSSFEKFKLQIEDGDESDENFTNDLKVIRKYFEELGLIEIVNKIDKDLGN